MEVLQTEHSLTKWNRTLRLRGLIKRLSYHANWHWSYREKNSWTWQRQQKIHLPQDILSESYLYPSRRNKDIYYMEPPIVKTAIGRDVIEVPIKLPLKLLRSLAEEKFHISLSLYLRSQNQI